MYFLVLFYFFGYISAVPIDLVQKITDNGIEKPKSGDFSKFQYATVGENSVSSNEVLNLIDPEELEGRSTESSKSLQSVVVDFVREGAEAGMGLINDVRKMLLPLAEPGTETNQQETTTAFSDTTVVDVTTYGLVEQQALDPVFTETLNRTTRQEEDVEGEKRPDDREKESQESDEEEEEPDMITGLISAFLGGLSRPDGSVDVEAITGLLGSLSSQNDDGTYDFNGLTELLMSFFGGGGEEGGGSDFGAFLGGLLGAFIKGVANPPGAKGAGNFVGNLIGAVLPGLSAPAPTEEGQTEKPHEPLDSGGFFGGLLSSVFGNLGNLSNSSGGGDHHEGVRT